MKKYDIVLLTESRYENPIKIDSHAQNILDDDLLVQNALEKKGFSVIRKDWASKNFDWSSVSYVIFRSTWDYSDRFKEFSAWLKQTEQKSTLINSSKTIFWNLDKHYLQDLEEKGVRVIPTNYIEKGETTSLFELHEKSHWSQTILKPAVSGAARHTYKLSLDNLERHEATFQQLIEEESMMLQSFQRNIMEYGEVSYMLFGGKFTHAVLKKAKKGDFRVQDDFGGTVELYQPTKEEITFSENAVNACDPLPVYARVDVIRDNNDLLCVVELELIEPELWFRLWPKAAEIFANAIEERISEID